MTEQLVYGKGEAIVQYCLSEEHLLCGDKHIRKHKFLGLVFNNMVVRVEEALSKWGGATFSENLLQLSLLSSSILGEVSSLLRIFFELSSLIFVKAGNIDDIHLDKAQKGDHFKNIGEGNYFEQVHLDYDIYCWEPAAYINCAFVFCQIRKFLNNFPCTILSILRMKIHFVEF